MDKETGKMQKNGHQQH